MFGKRKLKGEVVRLTYRVAELEERICPCESHEWKCVDMDWQVASGVGDVETIYDYRCKRCGKQMRTWKPFLDKDGENNG